MKLKMKSLKKKAPLKTKKKLRKKPGISFDELDERGVIPASEVRPKALKINRKALLKFTRVLDFFDVADPSEPVEAERLGIAIEGVKGSGKSSLVAGNPRCVIAKCYDGSPTIPHCRAKVVNCPDYKTFKKLLADMLRLGKKLGKDSPYTMLAVDPLSSVVRWEAEACVARHNRKFRDDEGRVIPSCKGKLIKGPSEIGTYGPWSDIAGAMVKMLSDIGEIGWGWATMVHYQWKASPDFSGPMHWAPNIPPTTADRIAHIADMMCCVSKTQDSFSVRFDTDSEVTGMDLSARVPIIGVCELPNYRESGEQSGLTSWDYLVEAYQRACRSFRKNEERFKELDKLIRTIE
jgi:hypothetical protein